MISSIRRREVASSHASSLIGGDEMVMLPRQNIKVDILPPQTSRSSWTGRNTAGNNNRRYRKYNADLNMPQYLYKQTPKQPVTESHAVPQTE